MSITLFRGEYGWLSNFHPCPITDEEGVLYQSVEHAYQAAKTLDKGLRIEISKLPGKGMKAWVKYNVSIREDWDEVKTGIMREFVSQKFRSGTVLAENLLATGDMFIKEGNYWHDNFWGDCTCPRCKGIPGQNVLGQILMSVRENLRR